MSWVVTCRHGGYSRPAAWHEAVAHARAWDRRLTCKPHLTTRRSRRAPR